MAIKIAHEAPISILDAVEKITDFNYALVHLFETHPAYFQHFYIARHEREREVLLDNSIFELGTAFDTKKYVGWIERLQPNYYIVPDVLEDAEATIGNFHQFCNEYGRGLPGMKIGAVQGKTFQEIVDCYRCMAEDADMVAISFDMSYFMMTGVGRTKLQRMASGRYNLIQTLIRMGIWEWDKPHHLLGCALPKEFSLYKGSKGIHNIHSIDTSNPVMAGLNGWRYNSTFGLETKIPQKLVERIDDKVSETQWDAIRYNIKQFRHMTNELSLLDSKF